MSDLTTLPTFPTPPNSITRPKTFVADADGTFAVLPAVVTAWNTNVPVFNTNVALVVQKAIDAAAAATSAGQHKDTAAASALAAQNWAAQLATPVADGLYSARYYAQQASTSASTAAARLADVEALYDQFDDRYLGVKASDPAVDNDGNPLQPGAIYVNSNSGFLRAYTGAAWVQGISALAGVESVNGLMGAITLKTVAGQALTGGGDVVFKTINGQQITGAGDLLPGATQAEMEAGTELAMRAMSPLRVSQAIAAHAKSGELTATASGAVTGAKAVHVNADGTVSTPTITLSTSAAATSTISTSVANVDANIVWHAGIGRYVAVWIRSSDSCPVAAIGTPAVDGTVSWSSATPVYGIAANAVATVYYPTEQRVLVIFRSQSSGQLYCIALNVTTTSIAAGLVSGGPVADYISIAFDVTAGKAVASFNEAGAGMTVRVVSVSGDSATWGSFVTTGNNGYETNIHYHEGAGKCIAFARYTNNYLYGWVISVSGSTPSFGPAYQLHAGAPGDRTGFAYSPTDGKAVISFRGSPADVDTFTAVLTVSGTALSIGSITSISTANHGGYNAMCYDPYTGRVAVFYRLDTSEYLATRTGTISGTSISWGTEAVLHSSGAVTAKFSTAYDTTNSRVCVCFISANLHAKTMRLGSSTLTAANFLGFAKASVSSGQAARVAVVGGVATGLSGLTPGQTYYVTSAGGLTTTATDIRAGLALTTTTLLVG